MTINSRDLSLSYLIFHDFVLFSFQNSSSINYLVKFFVFLIIVYIIKKLNIDRIYRVVISSKI